MYEVNFMWRQCRNVATATPVCSEFRVQLMQAETSWETIIGSPDPPVGAGYWYLIRARDGAGNWSDDACVAGILAPDASYGAAPVTGVQSAAWIPRFWK